MISQELIDYIKHQQHNGKNREEITAALLGQGWQAADVEQGFNSAASGIPMPVNDKLPRAPQIFNEAWIIYKARFKTLIGINLIPTLAFLILALLIGITLKFGHSLENSLMLVLIIPGIIILFIAALYFSLWATVAQLSAIKDQAEGIGYKEAFNRSKNKIIPFFIASLLAGLAVLGGTILLIIPGIIFGLWFSQVAYVVIEEGLTNSSALKRSKYYVTGRMGQVFGKLFYIGIITFALYIGVSILLGMINSLSGIDPDYTSWIVDVFSILWTPVATAYAYQLYKHLRATRP